MYNPFLMLATAATTVGPDAWSDVITAITAQINVAQIVAVLASVVGAGIGLVFLWWGVRKGVRTIMGSFRSGKLPL